MRELGRAKRLPLVPDIRITVAKLAAMPIATVVIGAGTYCMVS